MKTVNATQNQKTSVNKGQNRKNANKAVNEALAPKKQGKKKKKDVYASEYGKEVLTVNKKLKQYCKTFKGALSMLYLMKGAQEADLKLTKKQARILTQAAKGKNGKKVYELLESKTRTSKTGNSSPYYILQAIRRDQKELLELCK